jgi:hypothetical protein
LLRKTWRTGKDGAGEDHPRVQDRAGLERQANTISAPQKTVIGSFRLTGTIRVFERHIQLPRLGRLRLHERGYLPRDAHMCAERSSARVLSATVSEHARFLRSKNRSWFVSVQVEIDVPDPVPATGPALGVDLGIRTLATCSDGRAFANPKALEHAQKSLRWALRPNVPRQPLT